MVIDGTMPRLPTIRPNSSVLEKFKKTDLADANYAKSSTYDGILGAGAIAKIVKSEILTLDEGLIAQNTSLGWMIFGDNKDKHTDIFCGNFTTKEANDDALASAIRGLWAMDDAPGKREMHPDEIWCEEHFNRTTKCDKDGRYIITIPIRPGKENALNPVLSLYGAFMPWKGNLSLTKNTTIGMSAICERSKRQDLYSALLLLWI